MTEELTIDSLSASHGIQLVLTQLGGIQHGTTGTIVYRLCTQKTQQRPSTQETALNYLVADGIVGLLRFIYY
ncbi:MAG: hypothetical protein IPP11_07400 [Chitinophagaceae bacterium]|nr:hypothetical protein [Chitinophagaceae bacterium]